MGILDGIRSYFRDDESDLTEQAAALDRQRQGNPYGDLPEEIEEMPPEEVANIFAQMQQEDRLTFVRNKHISREKWDEMRSMIRNDSKQRKFWGLDGTQTAVQEGVEVCACHEEGLTPITETRGSQETISQTQGTSETSKTEVGGKMGGSGGTGIPGVGNMKATGEGSAKKGWTQGETQQEMAQVTDITSTTRTFHACRVEPTNSTVSRRAFLQVGHFHIGRKKDQHAVDTQSAIDNWTSTTETTSTQQEQSQKGIDTLRAEKNKIVDKIEDLDGDLEMYETRINRNKQFISQCEDAIAESEGDIDGDDIKKRDDLLDKHEEFREKKEEIQTKKDQLQSQKHELQNRIEDHEEYEDAQEDADTTESATQDADDAATEDTAESEDAAASEAATDDATQDDADEAADTESEEATETTDSEGTTETTDSEEATETTTEQTTDGTPESDGGPPDDGGGSDDRGGDPETDTESTGVDPGTEPAEASAEATTAANRSTPDDNDAPDQSEEPETDPTVSKGAIADRLTGANPSNGEGTGSTNSKNNHDEDREGPDGSSL